MAVASAMVGGEGCNHHASGDHLPAGDPRPLDRHTKADEGDLGRTFDTSYFRGLPRATLRELLAALVVRGAHAQTHAHTHA